jgi:hypothetical protein
MPELGIDVDAGTAAALADEATRLGFDSRAAYVRWLIARRGALSEDERVAGPTADGSGDGDGDGAPTASADGGVAVRSGRVAVADDGGVAEAAARLGSVDRERADALVRRARRRSQGGDDRPGADLAELSALDLPGRDPDLVERRRRLVGAALAFLREAGEARRGAFVDALREERPAGYDSDAGWWRCLARGLRQVDRVRDADAESPVWRYRDVRGRVHVSRDWE